MRSVRRGTKPATFSVSVSPATKARLKRAAQRAHGGNVSALIEAIVIEADRHDALEWLVRRGPQIDDAAFAEFMAEMAGRARKSRTRSAA